MKRVLPLLVITLFLAGIFIVPSVGLTSTARLQDNTINSSEMLVDDMQTSDLPNDGVFRVALYNETNTTVPDYHTSVTLNNNYSAIYTLLTGAGYDVDRLTFQDILDYDLTTANYDVLILADNLPRENITNHVKDFWLAGGGVLSLDSALAYLGYGGILYRENDTIDDGYPSIWAYNFDENSTILDLHPVTQSYQEGDILEVATSPGKASLKKEAFNQTSVWSQTTVLAEVTDDTDDLRAVAVDAYDRGGRVVHIGTAGGGNGWSADWEDMIVDAIAWLAPKPKARIAYDFSHQPRLSVDGWDVFSTLTDPVENFEDLRDLYVANRYTFDKFVPSAAGNFTEARLNQYDIMILSWPDLNYTVAEITAIETWVAAGGGLIVLGDRSGLAGANKGDLQINLLLDDFDMQLSGNNTLDFVNAVPVYPNHPTIGNAASLRISYRNYINITGPAAQSVWEYENNIIVAAQEYGDGRVVMFGDMNIFSSSLLSQQHNKGYASNVANWLSADDAHILVYSDDPYDGGPYRSSVAQVLNQMEIPFFMTVSDVGFNNSVNGTWFSQDTWDLVILDNNNYFYSSIYDGLYSYLMNDGRAIVNTYRINSLSDHPLWRLLGVDWTASWPSNAPAHIWDTGHEIFNTPINFGATTMNVSNAWYGDDGDMVTVFDNATALAGLSATEEIGNASIVLRNDGNTLLNTFLLNNMRGDIDESGYLDTLELWFDQIMFMLNLPKLDHPVDVTYESGSTGNTITWNPSHGNPSEYKIYVDGISAVNSTWDGSYVTYNIDGLSLGVHPVDIFVYGDLTQPVGDTVIVTVIDTTDPLLASPSDLNIEDGTTGNVLTWIASEPNPSHFVITMNTTTDWDSGVWDGQEVEIDLDSLAIGIYFFKLVVNDTIGHSSEDIVLVTVQDTVAPTLNSPADVEIESGEIANVTWTVSDLHPATYEIYVDGVLEDSGTWVNGDIDISVADLEDGEHDFTIIVQDASGNTATDTVVITVGGSIIPGLDDTTLLLIVIAIIALIIIAIVCSKRKK